MSNKNDPRITQSHSILGKECWRRSFCRNSAGNVNGMAPANCGYVDDNLDGITNLGLVPA